MAYVNFNPIRAKIADTPETPEHTDIQQRMKAIQQPYQYSLMPFIGNPRQEMPKASPFHSNYCELVYISDRTIRNDTAGHINHQNQSNIYSMHLCINMGVQRDSHLALSGWHVPPISVHVGD